jgi:hypothetical protein
MSSIVWYCHLTILFGCTYQSTFSPSNHFQSLGNNTNSVILLCNLQRGFFTFNTSLRAATFWKELLCAADDGTQVQLPDPCQLIKDIKLEQHCIPEFLLLKLKGHQYPIPSLTTQSSTPPARGSVNNVYAQCSHPPLTPSPPQTPSMRGGHQSLVDSAIATTNPILTSSSNQRCNQMHFPWSTFPLCNFTAPPIAPTVNEVTETSGLSKLIARLSCFHVWEWWQDFVKIWCGKGNFASLDNVNRPARRLLIHYNHRGAPVKFSTAPWTRDSINQAIKLGPHRSCNEYIDFLEEEFVDMIQKGQWVILPASVAK